MNNIDKDLAILSNANSDALKGLVETLTTKRNGKRRFAESLTWTAKYKMYYPSQLQLMHNDISGEIQRYASNTILYIFRGGVGYRKLLINISKTLGVDKIDKDASIEILEYKFLEKILVYSLNYMSVDEKKTILGEMELDFPTPWDGKLASSAIQMGVEQGRLSAYKIAGILENSFRSHFQIVRTLTIAANMKLNSQWLIFILLGGPLGWVLGVIGVIWTAFGPAYRVCLPALVKIIYIRAKMNSGEA